MADRPATAADTGLDQLGAPAAAPPVVARGNPLVLQRAVNSTSNGVVVADANGDDCPIVFVNNAFERITGYNRGETLGRNCRFLQGPDSDPAAVAQLADAVRVGQECKVTILNYRKDGNAFWNELFLSPIHDADGTVVQYVGIQNDVTERRRAEEHAQFLAYHDALTGLGNRALLEQALLREISQAAAHSRAVALLYLDLDGFKEVNDRFGHLVGDDLLCQAATRLQRVCRPGDVLTRQGGDEFLILLPELHEDPERAATAVAERASEAFRQPFELSGYEVSIGVSVGVSLYPSDAGDAKSLMAHADTAMYAAKNAGRNRVSRFVSDRATGPARRGPRPLTVPDSAREIIEEGAVRSVFQPIVELHNGAVVGYEALTRGPVGSPLERPDLLFEEARRDGLTGQLDWLCRFEALHTALEAGFARPLTLFVNAEPDTLDIAVPDYAQDVWRRASETCNLVMEVTEHALTASPAQLLGAVDRARAAGWGIALDDVGADVRSLALMPLLSPDVVKLDLRLIQQRPSVEVAEIVGAVSAYCERSGAEVLAEGIETDEHLKTAMSLGATLGQGWLFGHPSKLPTPLPWSRLPIPRLSAPNHGPSRSPHEIVCARLRSEISTKELLISISKHLESQALAIGSGAVVVAAFQNAERFTPSTRKRYEKLASRAALVAAFGVGLDPEPAPGVRGAPIGPGDELTDEWSVAVIGPHFAAALVARDLGDDGPDMQRRFNYAITYDRDLVAGVVRALTQRIPPSPSGPSTGLSAPNQ